MNNFCKTRQVKHALLRIARAFVSISRVARLSLLIAITAVAQVSLCGNARAQGTFQLYGQNSFAPELCLLNSASGAVLQTIIIGEYPYNHSPAIIALASDGARIWAIGPISGLGNSLTCMIFKIRAADGAMEDIWDTRYQFALYGIDFDPVSGKLYMCCTPVLGRLTLFELDLANRRLIKIASVTGPGAFANTFAISPSGQGYVFDALGPTVYLIDLATAFTSTFGSLSLPSLTGSFTEVAFDATGLLWASYKDSWNNLQTGLYKVDLTTLSYTKVISLATAYQGLTWGSVPPVVNYYCLPKLSSQGCTPSISAQGLPCAAAFKGFTIVGTNVPNQKPGLLMYGTSGSQNLPFQGGTLCVNPPIQRTPSQPSGGNAQPTNDCSGAWSIDFNAFLYGPIINDLSGPHTPVFPAGTTLNAQWWGRDPGYPAPFNSSLSNGLQFDLAP